MSKVIYYAPNVNTGGGLILLQALIDVNSVFPRIFIVDERAKSKLTLHDNIHVVWVKSGFMNRLKIESNLRNFDEEDKIVCLHNIPPFFKVKSKCFVFLQNKLLIRPFYSCNVHPKVFIRTIIEKLIFFIRSFCVDSFIVQTNTMKSDLEKSFIYSVSSGKEIKVIPFVKYELIETLKKQNMFAEKGGLLLNNYVFIYPADEQPHKNHTALFDAWVYLYSLGFKPTLKVTLTDESKLNRIIDEINFNHPGINIKNVGVLNHKALINEYAKADALIFPSVLESFGLPLVEAYSLNLPVIASDLDYVYDVCLPSQTFTPHNYKSIAAAVCRFSNTTLHLHEFKSAENFMDNIVGKIIDV